MKVFRCNQCDWIGSENEIVYDGIEDKELCPNCRKSGALMALDSGCNFWNGQIRELWKLFGDVPINDADQIEEEFLGFPEGTNRFDVWEWFDKRHNGGVYSLAYKGEM